MLSWLLLAASLACAAPSVTVSARRLAPGEAALIVVSGQAPDRSPRGVLGGRALEFQRGRNGAWVALTGFDLEESTGPKRLELELVAKEGHPHFWAEDVIVEAKAYPTQEVTVEQKYVTPSPEEEARAEAESKLLRAVYAASPAEALFRGGFRSPIPGALSGRFGERRVFNGVPKSPHTGADLRAKKGVPVKAAAGGKVVVAQDLFYSGRTVVVDHGLGLLSVYAHLSRVDVAAGQQVERGTRLGLVGATGRVSGPHLHWGVKLRHARVDPFSLVALPLSRYY